MHTSENSTSGDGMDPEHAYAHDELGEENDVRSKVWSRPVGV